MSDAMAYCPECGADAEHRGRLRGDVPAPPGYWRCPECSWATPCHLLPRRAVLNLLKTGSLAEAPSERIARGTHRTGTAVSVTTFPAVQCAQGSCLVVGVVYVPDPFDPTISFASLARGSQSFSVVQFSEGLFSASVGLYAIQNASGGTADVTIDPQGPCQMAAFAAEITLPVQPVTDAAGGSIGTGTSASATTGATSRAIELAIAVLGIDAGNNQIAWGGSFTEGQQDGPSECRVFEGYRPLTSIGTVTASASNFIPSNEWAMAVGTFRWAP